MAEFFRVHEEAVASYVQPGGQVSDLVYFVAKEAQVFARTYIHNRSGRLAANLQANRPQAEGPWKTTSLVFTNIKYAKYVIHGTYGPIYPTHGKWLRYSSRGGVYFAKSVNGQHANDFLGKGLADAMATIR